MYSKDLIDIYKVIVSNTKAVLLENTDVNIGLLELITTDNVIIYCVRKNLPYTFYPKKYMLVSESGLCFMKEES